MTSVITGDIIKSRHTKTPEAWITLLKKALIYIDSNTKNWEMYRGDGFQIEIADPSKSFLHAVYIKACIKTIKNLDVRLAIGVGEKSYQGNSVSESNGEAFVFSGETLEQLKKIKQNLYLKTPSTHINTSVNLYFKLALTFMDHWTVSSAEIVKLSIEHPNALQHELAQMLGTKQDAVSKRQKRAQLDAILELNHMFIQQLNTL